MLLLHQQLIDLTVASVQSGMPCGKVTQLIINPDNFAIALLVIQDPQGTSYLLPSDIRFMSEDRLIIDAEHKLSVREDLLRHQGIIAASFSPIGHPVATESKKRLGKVTNYSVDIDSWQVAKLYVTAGILENPLLQEKLLDRRDIISVEGKKIIVRDLHNRLRNPLRVPLPKNIA